MAESFTQDDRDCSVSGAINVAMNVIRSPVRATEDSLRAEDTQMPESPGDAFSTPEPRVRSDSDSAAMKGRRFGGRVKRLATSPLQESDSPEMRPAPLSDAELQALKSSLAMHESSFASINAASKESTARKRELETIIGAYRAAFDKVATAYIKIKAERDTTSAIWRAMKREASSDAIREESDERNASDVRGVVKEVFQETMASMGDFVKSVIQSSLSSVACDIRANLERPSVAGSYANAVRSSSRGESQRDLGRSSDAVSNARLDTMEIAPSRELEDKFTDSSATMDAVLKAVKPNEAGFKVDRIIKGRNKVVRIVAAPAELDKIGHVLSGSGLTVRQFPKLNPRLLVRDVPVDMDKETFIKSLISQNLCGASVEDVKLIYRFPSGERRNTSVVVEVSPENRRKLLEQGRVYLGWNSCRLADHLRVTQCFECLGFGHISRECRAERDVCGHCGEAHETRACKNKSGKLKCHNCVAAKSAHVDHSALDMSKCPILRRRLGERSMKIQY